MQITHPLWLTPIKYIFSIALGLVVLVFFEGIMTLGNAFNFETYSIVGWTF